MGVRYETFSAAWTGVHTIKAGQAWNFHEDATPSDVHGLMLLSDEAAVFVGTKSELQDLLRWCWAAVEALPPDRVDGSAQPVVELFKLD